MGGPHHKIGQVAAQLGISVRTLRHYDEIGLLTPSSRTAEAVRRNLGRTDARNGARDRSQGRTRSEPHSGHGEHRQRNDGAGGRKGKDFGTDRKLQTLPTADSTSRRREGGRTEGQDEAVP